MSKFVERIVRELEQGGRFAQERLYMQHCETTVYQHSINVAEMSLKIARKFKIRVNKRSLVRAALLHDYFLYDWHIPDPNRAFHPNNHPKVALRNALEDYELNEVEQEAILCHMFPIAAKIPRYRESWIVTAADKCCAVFETCAPRAKAVSVKSYPVQNLVFHFLKKAI